MRKTALFTASAFAVSMALAPAAFAACADGHTVSAPADPVTIADAGDTVSAPAPTGSDRN